MSSAIADLGLSWVQIPVPPRCVALFFFLFKSVPFLWPRQGTRVAPSSQATLQGTHIYSWKSENSRGEGGIVSKKSAGKHCSAEVRQEMKVRIESRKFKQD